MSQPDVQGAIEYARRRLALELDPELVYHSYTHTFDDVLPAAMRLAELYHLNQHEANLVAIAAAFHDVGWVIQGIEHERISANIASRTLPAFGFSQEDIERIYGMIMATRLPQTPHNLLEEIIADADLDVLGRDDFWPRNVDLRNEVSRNGIQLTDEEWYTRQLRFLESHRYWTEAAQQLRSKLKWEFVGEMRERLVNLAMTES